MCEHAQPARLDVLDDGCRTGGQRVDLLAEQADDRRAGAGVRHMDHEGAGGLLEHLHRHVHRAVVARRAEGDRARFVFRVSDELGVGLPRAVGANCEHRRIGGEARDRHQLVQLVQRRAIQDLVGLGQDRDRRQRQQQGVAIRGSLGGVAHPDAAAGARLVFDDDGLTEVARQRFGHRPADRVGYAARRKGNDHVDRAARVLLGIRRPGERDERCADRRTRHAGAQRASP